MESKSNLITRRTAIASMFLATLSSPAFLMGEQTEDISFDLRDIQKKSGGRLGCAVLDTFTGRRAGIRLNERFSMCSTSKVASTALVLQRVDKGIELLERTRRMSTNPLYTFPMDTLWTPWRYQYVSTVNSATRQGVPPLLAEWPGDCGCVFCNLLEATAYAVEHDMQPDEADRSVNIVYRGEHCYVCLNAFPYNSGHAMIVPYAHIDELSRLGPPVAQEMMALAQRLEQILRSVYRPDGINLGMNLGKAAGAGVAGHLHLHMLPRWAGDTNFMTVIGETRVLPESLAVTWERLREAWLKTDQ